MKKILALILCVLLLASFAACAAKPNADFKAPENYTAVIKVTINPEANLYVDAQNVVLAIEYINTDAKDTYEKIENKIVGAPLDSGVKTLIDTASDAGFFADEKKVTVDIVECKMEENKKAVLSVAASAAKQQLEEKQIAAPLDVKDNGTAIDDQLYNEVVKQATTATTTTTMSTTVATTAATTVATTTAKPTTKATTTVKPTTKAPSVQYDRQYIAESPSELPSAVAFFVKLYLQKDGTYAYGFGDYGLTDEYAGADVITYNGKKYYAQSGGGGGGNYTISGNTVILTEDEIVLTMNANGTLTITSGDDGYLSTGKVFKPN